MTSKRTLIPPHLKLCVILFLSYIIISAIPTYGLPVITTRLILDNGWDDGVLSIISMVNLASYVGGAALAGRIISKIGCRKTGTFSILFSFAGMVIMRLFDLPWYLYVTVYALFGIGASAVLLIVPTLLNKWYDRRKALPTAVIMSSGALGGFIFPQVSARLLQISVDAAWTVYLLLVLADWLLFALLIRELPEEEGERKDGLAWVLSHPETASEKNGQKTVTECSLTVGECYRTAVFYKLLAGMMTMRAVNSCMASYLLLYAIQEGCSDTRAAACLSAMSIVGLAGRLSAGLLDKLRIPYRAANIASFAGAAAGLLLLATAKSYVLFLAAAGLVGASFGLNYNLFVLIVPKVFGNKNFSALYGTYNAAGSVGASLGPVLVYAVAKLFAGYSTAFLSVGILCAVCTVMAFFTPIRPVEK